MNLTSGALEQSATDLDIGRGLAFTRHYASNYPSTPTGTMGTNWRHSLEWKLEYQVVRSPSATQRLTELAIVGRPLGRPIAFGAIDSGPWSSGTRGMGGLARESSNLIYTDDDGTRVVFTQTNPPAFDLAEIQRPGEPKILVTKTGTTTTFKGSGACVIVTENASAQVVSVAGRFGSDCSAGPEQSWVYGYADGCLHTVTGPNPGSPNASVVWTYSYEANGPICRLNKIERKVGSEATVVVAEWAFSNSVTNRPVNSASEPALDQKLCLGYSNLAFSNVTTTVCQAPSTESCAVSANCTTSGSDAALLATFTSSGGRVTGTIGAGGPSVGGPGVDLPFLSATHSTSPTESGAPANLRNTTTDLNNVSTLYEDYDARGRPARVTEGWKDTNDNHLIDGAETYLRRRDYEYHPNLDRPTKVTEQSSITGAFDHKTFYDYDDPADPNRPHRIRVEGKTLGADGQPTAFADETTFTYNAANQVASISGPRPEQHTEFDYDATSGSRSALRRYLNGPTSSFLQWTFSGFDAQGNPQWVTDPNGRVTSFTYDSLNRVRTATPPYEGTGSTTITFQYDVDGNLTRVDFPPDSASNAVFLRLGYDAAKPDLLRFVADSQGNAIVYTYEKGRATREERYTGFVSLANLGTRMGDATFRYYKPNDPPNNTSNGRLWKAFNPLFPDDTVYSEFVPDAKGNPTSIRDENGKQDALLYDALDRLETISQLRTATYETEFTYDALSNVTRVTDAAAKATDLLHDDRGNLVETLSPDTGRTRFLYDAAGNLVTKIENAPAPGSAGGRVTSYSYDGLDRLTAINLPNDPDWIFTYDADETKNQKGRLASVTNGMVTIQLEYTQRGDVAVERTIVDGLAYAVHYQYDAAGNRTRVQGPSGSRVDTIFAGLRPSTATIVAGTTTQQITDLAWYPFGPRTQAKFPPSDGTANTVVSARTVNLRGQITELDVTSGAAAILDRSYKYDYTAGTPGPTDPGPNLDRVDDHLDASESRFYFYDELDRLEKATDLTGSILHQYGHDAVGNRTSKLGAAGLTNYSYEPATNRLDAATVTEPRDYAHDAYGNRIYDGAAPFTGTPSLLYDDANRLVEVRDPANAFATIATYTYDAFGRRVKKVVGTQTTLFFYDSEGHLVEEIEKVAGANNDHARFYVFVDDELVGLVDKVKEVGAAAWISPLGAPFEIEPPLLMLAFALAAGLGVAAATRRWPVGIATTTSGVALVLLCAGAPRGTTVRFTWVHTDPLGTPLAVTNTPATGAAVAIWRASYEPFGKATVDEDPDGNTGVFSLSVRFPGQYADAETGWYFNLNRYFDPAVGAYTQPDPAGLAGGLQIYSYAKSDPINLSDRFGLESCGGSSPSMNWMRPLARIPRFGNPLKIFFDAGDAKLPFAGTPADQDAFRHCLASCEVQRQYGSDVAAYLDELNELKGGILGNQSAGDRQMDEINNAIGRSLVRYPLSGQECSSCKYECELAVRQQVLTTVLFGRGQRYPVPGMNR